METGVGLAMILATVQYNSTPELTPQLYSSILLDVEPRPGPFGLLAGGSGA